LARSNLPGAHQAEQPSTFAPKLLVQFSYLCEISGHGKTGLISRGTARIWIVARLVLTLARYFCAAKPLLLFMASDEPLEAGSNMFSLVLFHFSSLLRSDFSRSQLTPFPQDLQLGTSRFRMTSTKEMQYLFLFPRLSLPTLSKLDQLMHTLGSLSINDGHRFDRQSDRSCAGLYEWSVWIIYLVNISDLHLV